MFEKVNPSHPDKVADRIAGAVVDLAYNITDNPRIAVEVLIGHGTCKIIAESSVSIKEKKIQNAVDRITGSRLKLEYTEVPQDGILSGNQKNEIRCGDNGIFKGTVVTAEQKRLSDMARRIYKAFPTDGKYIMDGEKVVICQSHASKDELSTFCPTAIINPLGEWTGGPDVDCGATNRKLGSDMGDSVTGGGLHGKDLSKADVSVNIYAWLEAQKTGRTVQYSCAIGDTEINGVPYSEIVETARAFIEAAGGFENFAMWGLI